MLKCLETLTFCCHFIEFISLRDAKNAMRNTYDEKSDDRASHRNTFACYLQKDYAEIESNLKATVGEQTFLPCLLEDCGFVPKRVNVPEVSVLSIKPDTISL